MGYSPEIVFHLTLTSARQAVDFYLGLAKISDLGLSILDKQWDHMKDLEVILGVSLDLEFQGITCLRNHIQVSHRVQTIVSQESNPVLLGATPSYEMFMTNLEMLSNNKDRPQMKVLVAPGLEKSYKYYQHMDHTKVYVIGMRT